MEIPGYMITCLVYDHLMAQNVLLLCEKSDGPIDGNMRIDYTCKAERKNIKNKKGIVRR